jgi:hypothetical protein
VDDALWYCQVRVTKDSYDGPCLEQVRQDGMEDHLHTVHRVSRMEMRAPYDVIGRFTLARGSHHGKPPRQPATDDKTIEMFGKDEFR